MAAAFRVSLEIKADPAIVDAAQALAKALAGLGLRIVPEQEPVETQARSATPIVEPPKRDAVATPPPAAPSAPIPPKPEGVTLAAVRDAARALADKDRPALVALLATFKSASLAQLAEADYERFVAEANVKTKAAQT